MPRHSTQSETTIKRENLEDYAAFTQYVDKVPQQDSKIYFLFTGKKKDNGRSWCMYCQLAEPVIEAYLTEVKCSITFAFVDVGDKDTFKKPDCPFRTDRRTRLMVIPTIIRWYGVQRLEGTQCSKRELLQMLIEEDHD